METAALGCLVEQRSTVFESGTNANCRALLGWTAEGGCPHVIIRDGLQDIQTAQNRAHTKVFEASNLGVTPG